MKILVTGGTGVIGTSVVRELLQHGHRVRLLSRHADDDARQWNGVESFTGDITDRHAITGAATGCDAVVHIAGIVEERPPQLTFEKVNVGGTRHIAFEAERAGVRRFVLISSLGADTGTSDYHHSKLSAEEVIAHSNLDWIIVRPGNVFGPGDEVISTIVKMIRVLPVFPVIDDGEQQFQPLWHEDLAKAIVALVEHTDYLRTTIELAGPDITSVNDLLRRLREITERTPVRIPVPMPFASIATKLVSKAAEIPVDETKLTMLRESKLLLPDSAALLTDLIGGPPTTLDRGLRVLVDALPEKLPEDGVGKMQHKTFRAQISGSSHTAASLMKYFRDHITELMPIEFAAEPGAPTRIEHGVTMTGAIPLRGNIQVRVEVVEPTRVVFATVEGHPLAGIVEFTTGDTSEGIFFAIDTWTRASNALDYIGMKTIGNPAQAANWRSVVRHVIDASGGVSDGVHEATKTLDHAEGERMDARVRSMVQERQRAESRAGKQTP